MTGKRQEKGNRKKRVMLSEKKNQKSFG